MSAIHWVDCLKVIELKAELLERGQLTSGLRDVLVARVKEVRIFLLNLNKIYV